MPSFTGSEIAEWCGGEWAGAVPGTVHGIATDTRKIEAGSLFIALKGPRFDGHDFVSEALGRGAAAAVVRRDWTPPAPVRSLLRVADTGAALRSMAAGYRHAVNPLVVAVTGSAGKSTVKEMTAQILSAAMPTACTRGNWNNEIGLPLSLLDMGRSSRAGVFEVGVNHPGEMRPLADLLRPACTVVTNIGAAHVGNFGSVRAIADEKAWLLRCLPPEGVAVLSRDGGEYDVLRAAAPGRVVTVAMDGDADYACVGRDAGCNEATIVERASGERATVCIPLPGAHQVLNAMQGIAVARGLGVGWELIRAALAAYASLPMRWEERSLGGLLVVNDAYNANPLSMRASLRAFAERPGAVGKWLLLGGMLELGGHEEAEHVALGAELAGGPWEGLIVVGPYGEWIARGAESGGMHEDRIFRCRDNVAAAAVAAEKVAPGHVLLLKASRSMRLEEIVRALETRRRA